MSALALVALSVWKIHTLKLFAGAQPTHDNAFKLQLAERTLGAVLAEAKG